MSATTRKRMSASCKYRRIQISVTYGKANADYDEYCQMIIDNSKSSWIKSFAICAECGALRTELQRASRRASYSCWAIALILGLGLNLPALSATTTITYAGLAYTGDAKNIDSRFKYSKRYEARLKDQATDIHSKLRQTVQARSYPFALNMTGNTEIKGDETLVTTLTITDETISEETFGSVHKLLVQIRAQAMIFDFQSKMLLRAYPLSFAYLDALDHAPSDAEIDDRIAKAYEGVQEKDGIFGRYSNALAQARLPRNDGLFLQITNVTIDADARAAFPEGLSQQQGVAETWLADHLDEALNAYAGVPVVPYSVGYALGNVMQLQLANSNFNIKFPDPNVEVSVELTGVKRVQYAQNNVGTSYIYGAFATIKIATQGNAHTTLNASFKNGEVKEVPVTQGYVDDLPAYNDAIRGLFNKLSEELGGKDTPWLKSATTAPDITAQLVASRGLLQKCK
jgi:hypothetical protein